MSWLLFFITVKNVIQLVFRKRLKTRNLLGHYDIPNWNDKRRPSKIFRKQTSRRRNRFFQIFVLGDNCPNSDDKIKTKFIQVQYTPVARDERSTRSRSTRPMLLQRQHHATRRKYNNSIFRSTVHASISCNILKRKNQ